MVCAIPFPALLAIGPSMLNECLQVSHAFSCWLLKLGLSRQTRLMSKSSSSCLINLPSARTLATILLHFAFQRIRGMHAEYNAKYVINT